MRIGIETGTHFLQVPQILKHCNHSNSKLGENSGYHMSTLRLTLRFRSIDLPKLIEELIFHDLSPILDFPTMIVTLIISDAISFVGTHQIINQLTDKPNSGAD